MIVSLGLQDVVVDAVDNGRVNVFTAGRRDDDFLRAGLDVLAGGFARAEEAGAFKHNIDAQLAPRQLGRVALRANADAVAIDDHVIAVDFDSAREIDRAQCRGA